MIKRVIEDYHAGAIRHLDDVYAEIKQDARPLVIYGAGNLAGAVSKKLKEKGIRLSACYADVVGGKFGDLEVWDIREIEEQFGKGGSNCILGFAASYRMKEAIENSGMFNKVFSITNPFDHHLSFDIDFIETNIDKLESTYEMLADQKSKDSFIAFLKSRIANDATYVLSHSEEDIDEFNNDVTHTVPEEVFLDIGAYNGGSISRFLRSNKDNYKEIIAIEPEDKNFRILVSKYGKKQDIRLYKIGCWKEKGRLAFNKDDDKCCRLDEDSTYFIDVDKLDNIVADKKISMLNLGISTAQLEILQGGEEIIKRDKPRLVIFMGSSKESLFLVPAYIKSINPEYKLFLRFQSSLPSRLFLYGI